MNLTVCQDPGDVARRAADAFVEAVAAAGERPAVCLAGGSTPQATHHLLTTPEYADRVEWARVHVFFGDERRVPLDDPRSNYRAACESLLHHVPVTAANVHPLTDADQYEGLLRAFFGDRCEFDILFLGMGDDGHTASLFPGSVSLLEQERWVPRSRSDRSRFFLYGLSNNGGRSRRTDESFPACRSSCPTRADSPSTCAVNSPINRYASASRAADSATGSADRSSAERTQAHRARRQSS